MMKKFVLALVCGTFAAVSFGTVHYVSPDGAGTKDGSSPENARAWIGLAPDKTPTFLAKGDTLKLLDGTYTSRTMRMTDAARDEITIEGNVEHPENVVIADGTSTLYYFKCAGRFTVQGITFKNFKSSNTSVLSLYESTPSVTIRHCIFTDTTSSSRAVCSKVNGEVVIEDCVVNNWSSDYGAFQCENTATAADFIVRRCTFTNCTGQTSAAILRGKRIEDCAIVDCSSTANNGGALSRFLSDAVISNCVFKNCSAGAKYGGAICVDDNPVTIVDSKFIGCSALFGAAIYSNTKAVTCRNCLFEANYVSAVDGGGSVLRIGSSVANTNDNCTFVNNVGMGANANNAPIHNGKAPVMNNGIFWNNLDKEGGTLRATSSSSHNAATVNCAADLTLGGTKSALLTASPFVDAENGDYSLAKKVAGEPNPCLGTGVKLDWMTADTLDLAGHPRLRGDDIVDLGCYEYFSKSGLMLLVR